jgi:hypothetical protein
MVWAPAIDVVEKEDKFFVKVELPGVKEEDVTVTGPYGSFASCLKIKEWTPLEPDFLEYKYYSLGVGLVLEENAETGECVELIDTMTDNKG